jgi:hypothetical protein
MGRWEGHRFEELDCPMAEQKGKIYKLIHLDGDGKVYTWQQMADKGRANAWHEAYLTKKKEMPWM